MSNKLVTTTRIDSDLKSRLQIVAKQNNRSISSQIEVMLEESLNNNNPNIINNNYGNIYYGPVYQHTCPTTNYWDDYEDTTSYEEEIIEGSYKVDFTE